MLMFIGALMDAIDFPEKVGTIAGNWYCLINFRKMEKNAVKM